MENCLQKAPDVNLVYTINEPAAAGAFNALRRAGKERNVIIVSIDGGCQGVADVGDGKIAATSQQYPLKMAAMGVEAAVAVPRDRQEAERLHRYRRDADRGDTRGRCDERGREDRNGALLGKEVTRAVLGPFLALIAACVFFAAQSDRFLTSENLSLVLQQAVVVGVIAIGQTLVILTAGIDLSCGTAMALGGIVMSKFAVDLGLPAPVAVAGGIGAPALIGFANGLLVTIVKLPPFIVTLGTMNIAFAITQLYSNSQTVTDLPPLMTALGDTFSIAGTQLTWGVLLMLALYGLAWFVLRETAVGRHVYALGNNPEAARLVGIPARRMLLGVYVLAGVVYGIASLLSVGRTGVGDPNAGQTENLDAITAVVLGGTSLFGGRGVVVGSLIGTLIVGVFRNGLTLMGVSGTYQVLVTGILVIIAVAADQISRQDGELTS